MLRGLLLTLIFAIGLLPGCRSEPQVSAEAFKNRAKVLEARVVQDYAVIRQKTIDAAEQKLSQWDPSTSDRLPTLNILVLSSGGQYGAFGAGVLEGWGEVTDPDMRRPTFDRVTGVSTGALMAPYAMAGTDRAYQKLAEFYANPDTDWVAGSPIWSILWNRSSLYNNAKLEATVRQAIDKPLLQAIAARAANSAALLVGATNLDLYRFQVFDLTKIASEGDEQQFEDAMLASAAIPGLFPPVQIDDWSYADGGASANLFLGLDEDLFWREAPAPWWQAAPDQGSVPKLRVRYWIIINGRIEQRPKRLTPSWSVIGQRGVRQYLRSAHIRSLQQIDMIQRLAAQRPDIQLETYWISVPSDARLPAATTGEMFEPDQMRAMVELGREAGADPASWQTQPPTLVSEWGEPED